MPPPLLRPLASLFKMTMIEFTLWIARLIWYGKFGALQSDSTPIVTHSIPSSWLFQWLGYLSWNFFSWPASVNCIWMCWHFFPKPFCWRPFYQWPFIKWSFFNWIFLWIWPLSFWIPKNIFIFFWYVRMWCLYLVGRNPFLYFCARKKGISLYKS